MNDPQITEAWETLRTLTPGFAHDLINVLERRLTVAETLARVTLEQHLSHVEMDTHSRKAVIDD